MQIPDQGRALALLCWSPINTERNSISRDFAEGIPLPVSGCHNGNQATLAQIAFDFGCRRKQLNMLRIQERVDARVKSQMDNDIPAATHCCQMSISWLLIDSHDCILFEKWQPPISGSQFTCISQFLI